MSKGTWNSVDSTDCRRVVIIDRQTRQKDRYWHGFGLIVVDDVFAIFFVCEVEIARQPKCTVMLC